MRLPTHWLLRYLVLGLVLVFASPGSAFADARSEARAHYQQGVKLYNAGDYRSAIKEFSAAQQLAPADLNNYNLALCYDKLGDPEPAIQYYRAYLDKVPNTDKKAEIDASIARLEAAAKSVAAKREAEARKAEEARRAAEAKKAAEDAKKAEADRKAGEAKGPVVGPTPPVGPQPPATDPVVGPTRPDEPPVDTRRRGVGSTGVPSSGTATATGDSQLDRAQSLNIDQIRDQRVGGSASGMPDTRGGPAQSVGTGVDPVAPTAAGPNAAPPPSGPNSTAGAAPMDPSQPDKPKATPVYKKWWFWAVVAVSAYVVYSIASEDSRSDAARTLDPKMFSIGGPQQQSGGLTLMRW